MLRNIDTHIYEVGDNQEYYKRLSRTVRALWPGLYLNHKAEYGSKFWEMYYHSMLDGLTFLIPYHLGLNEDLTKILYWIRASYFTPLGHAGKKLFFEYMESKGLEISEETFAIRVMVEVLSERNYILTQELYDMIVELAGSKDRIKTPEVKLVRFLQEIVDEMKIIKMVFPEIDYKVWSKIKGEITNNSVASGVFSRSQTLDEYWEKIPQERRCFPNVDDEALRVRAFMAFDEISKNVMRDKPKATVLDCMVYMALMGDYLFSPKDKLLQ